ncbi:MAG: ABC transporter ATP-binding protein [Muribaculaceae bacterium]|nr:ABC transporter ATP-binding protein [Muribaculaceae bacterium]
MPDTDLRPSLIRLKDVALVRGQRVILSDINLTIRRGDFVAVTGPNGGGKTTLMRLILGLLKPTSGVVERKQKNVRVSYLPQKSSIDSGYPISVREVIASGRAGKDSDDLVDKMLEKVELTDHASKPIGALSGGQQQRALLGRALISNPEMLVLDEPLSYVDKHFEQRIYDIIRELAPTTTIILVSHEITTVAAIANRHLIVDRTLTVCSSAHHFAKIALCD